MDSKRVRRHLGIFANKKNSRINELVDSDKGPYLAAPLSILLKYIEQFPEEEQTYLKTKLFGGNDRNQLRLNCRFIAMNSELLEPKILWNRYCHLMASNEKRSITWILRSSDYQPLRDLLAEKLINHTFGLSDSERRRLRKELLKENPKLGYLMQKLSLFAEIDSFTTEDWVKGKLATEILNFVDLGAISNKSYKRWNMMLSKKNDTIKQTELFKILSHALETKEQEKKWSLFARFEPQNQALPLEIRKAVFEFM